MWVTSLLSVIISVFNKERPASLAGENGPTFSPSLETPLKQEKNHTVNTELKYFVLQKE